MDFAQKQEVAIIIILLTIRARAILTSFLDHSLLVGCTIRVFSKFSILAAILDFGRKQEVAIISVTVRARVISTSFSDHLQLVVCVIGLS